jgi:transposase
MRHRLGISRDQLSLFSSTIDDYIAQDNITRVIDKFVDTLDLKELKFKKAEVAKTGRPPFNPGDMLKLYIYGYMHGLRSSRVLERNTKINIELKWLLKDLSPDFKTIADFRKDHSEALENVFKQFVLFLSDIDLICKNLVSIDGSKFRAQNSLKRNFNKETLENRIKKIDEKSQEYMSMLDKNDHSESSSEQVTLTPDQVLKKIDELEKRKKKYQVLSEELEKNGETQISITDPDSRKMKDKQSYDMNFNVQTSVEGKNKLVVDFKVTNQCNDKNLLTEMALRAKEILKSDKLEVTADKGYYNSAEIVKCLENEIIPYVPEENRTANDKRHAAFQKDKFIYDAQNDEYICPCDKKIVFTGVSQKRDKTYRCYYCNHYSTCEFAKLCCSGKRGRSIYRLENEEILEEHRKRVRLHRELIEIRKTLSEHPFGTVKRSLGMYYVLLKGTEKVKTEMSLIWLSYNLKRAINILGVQGLIKSLSEKKQQSVRFFAYLLFLMHFCLLQLIPETKLADKNR